MAREKISTMDALTLYEKDSISLVVRFGEDELTFSSKDSFDKFYETIDLLYAKAFQEGEIHMLHHMLAKHDPDEGAHS